MQFSAFGWEFGVRCFARRIPETWLARHERVKREREATLETEFMPELRQARTPFGADLHVWALPGDNKRLRRVV